jgi:hypothetical protein
LRSGGGFTGHLLASEAVATGDFPNILLNAMNKRAAGLQGAGDRRPRMLYTKATINDYKSQDRVRDGFFGELPIVAENWTYTEIDEADRREGQLHRAEARRDCSRSPRRRFATTISVAIARFPGKLARAGRWTLKNYITNFFKNNTTYGRLGRLVPRLAREPLDDCAEPGLVDRRRSRSA